jgi:hypothetical protein
MLVLIGLLLVLGPLWLVPYLLYDSGTVWWGFPLGVTGILVVILGLGMIAAGTDDYFF